MRYRALSPTGDFTIGQSAANFLVNSPAAVAQAVKTRLGLATGEWFLDTTDGTPYSTQILGTNTQGMYDSAIQERILGTPGVTGIVSYYSGLDSKRVLTVEVTINTQYGVAEPITQAF